MGRKPNIEYINDTNELRQSVGSKIRETRKRLNMTQRDLAQALDMDYVTLSKLEQGHSELKLEYLYRLSKFFLKKTKGLDGSMAYLIGELDDYHSYSEKALCEQTGLDPKALQVMKEAQETKVFLELINHIIRAFVSGKPRHSFPTAEITKYMEMIRSYKSLETHPLFETVRSLARKELSYTEIKEKIFEMGYTDKNINPADIIQIINYTYFREYDKRTFRIDIQDLFSDFMRSDFVEGK